MRRGARSECRSENAAPRTCRRAPQRCFRSELFERVPAGVRWPSLDPTGIMRDRCGPVAFRRKVDKNGRMRAFFFGFMVAIVIAGLLLSARSRPARSRQARRAARRPREMGRADVAQRDDRAASSRTRRTRTVRPRKPTSWPAPTCTCRTAPFVTAPATARRPRSRAASRAGAPIREARRRRRSRRRDVLEDRARHPLDGMPPTKTLDENRSGR